MSIKKRFRKAGITIEVAIAIALSVAVLFLVLGMFSDNLQTMATKSGLAKQTDTNATENKVAYAAGGNPTATQINVQLVGDQGTLAWYNAQAKTTIENLGAKANLTDQELVDLARALTVFAESIPSQHSVTNGWQNEALSSAKLAGGNLTYAQVASKNNIYLFWGNPAYQTNVNTSTPRPPYIWGPNSSNPTADPTLLDSERMPNIQAINKTFN